MDRGQLSLPLEIGIIIVTHNSERTIERTLSALFSQFPRPSQVIVVDSGSSSTVELKRLGKLYSFEMAFMPNIGFSEANNWGYRALEASCDYILFLNPDLVLAEGVLGEACAFLETHADFAAVSPLLLRYDFDKDMPTSVIDSAGIGMTWYGHFFDRFQGEELASVGKDGAEEVDALCGACLIVRKKALKSVLLYKNQVFDERFFCYKEDIDLSLRLRDRGGKLGILWGSRAYHGRGWQRKRMARSLRIMSAENEFRIHLMRGNFFGVVYSSLKWLGVVVFNL